MNALGICSRAFASACVSGIVGSVPSFPAELSELDWPSHAQSKRADRRGALVRRECLTVALLPSRGTELVILSACDSGTGEVKIGEGVMSLRRAFRIAGAQTVLASHWKVSDKATSQLMTV